MTMKCYDEKWKTGMTQRWNITDDMINKKWKVHNGRFMNISIHCWGQKADMERDSLNEN